jgi:hypothetical protein
MVYSGVGVASLWLIQAVVAAQQQLMLGLIKQRVNCLGNWSKHTFVHLKLYGVLRRLAREVAPTLVWSSIQLHKNWYVVCIRYAYYMCMHTARTLINKFISSFACY